MTTLTAYSADRSCNRFLNISRKGLLIAVLYIYIYNPIFLILGIGSIKLLLFIAIVYSFINLNVIKLLAQFKREAIFTFVIMFYAALTILRNDPDFSYVLYLHAIWFLECIYLPVVLVIWFRKDFVQYGWEPWVIITGFIAALITGALILRPEWNDFVRSSLISYSLHDFDEYWFRGFGIAEGLAGSYGVIQGIILGMCLWLVPRHALYAVPIIPLLISIAFNARTGFVAVIIALALLIARHRFNIRLIAIVVGIAVLLGYVLQSDMDIIDNNRKTIEWATSSFTQAFDFTSGKTSNGETVLDTLFVDEVFFVPSAIGLLFGEGVFVFHGKGSDVGYITQILFGGIIYLILLIGFLAFMYLRISRQNNEGFYRALFVVVLLIANMKSNYLFVPSGIFRLFSLYYFLVLTRQPQLSMISSSKWKPQMNKNNNFYMMP